MYINAHLLRYIHTFLDASVVTNTKTSAYAVSKQDDQHKSILEMKFISYYRKMRIIFK